MSFKLAAAVVLIALTGQVLANVEYSENNSLLNAAVQIAPWLSSAAATPRSVIERVANCYNNVAQIVSHVRKEISLTLQGYQLYLNLTKNVLQCFFASSDEVYDCGITAFGEYKRVKHAINGNLQHSKKTLSQLIHYLPKCLSGTTLPKPPPKFENLTDD